MSKLNPLSYTAFNRIVNSRLYRDSDTASDPVMREVALSGMGAMDIIGLHPVMKSALFRIYVNHVTGDSLKEI